MHPYIEKLNQYIKENPTSRGQMEVGSILEFLAARYLEEYPVTSGEIKAIQSQMDPYFESLGADNSNKLFGLVYDLCGNYEAAAFREGLYVGLRLREEIAENRNITYSPLQH